jgi:hypothetical protein
LATTSPGEAKLVKGAWVEIARGEMVEAELDRLIEKRASREPDPDEQEELWKESVRRYTARRRGEMRAAWASFHEGQAVRAVETLKGRCATS